MSELTKRKARFEERYVSGKVPWNDVLPPPEVIRIAKDLAPGRALDIGCGYGRTAIYLAQRGWWVDGVDFVDIAIQVARERARQAGVQDYARFHVGTVTELDFLDQSCDLAVDIGCLHGLPVTELEAYYSMLNRALANGGVYLLFAHLRQEAEFEGEHDHGIGREDVLNLFQNRGFTLLEAAYGSTQTMDCGAWPSAWLRFRRQGG